MNIETSEELQQNVIESTDTTVEGQKNDSTFNTEEYLLPSSSTKSKLETPSEITPPETFGIGANKNVNIKHFIID